MEYELFIDDKFDFLKDKAKELLGKEWDDIKKSNRDIARAMRRVYLSMDYSEAEYNDTLNTYKSTIENYDAIYSSQINKHYNIGFAHDLQDSLQPAKTYLINHILIVDIRSHTIRKAQVKERKPIA